MQGPSLDNQDTKGIVPRVVDSVFNLIAAADETLDFTIKVGTNGKPCFFYTTDVLPLQVSMIEIYMEKIRDLLEPANTGLQVHEDQERGVFIKGCAESFVTSPEHIFDALRYGCTICVS